MSDRPAVYGSAAALNVVRQQVERALAIQLEERDSSFHGGAYFVTRAPGLELRVQANQTDPSDPEDLAEPDHPNHRTLVYVLGCTDAGLGAQLPGVEGLEQLSPS